MNPRYSDRNCGEQTVALYQRFTMYGNEECGLLSNSVRIFRFPCTVCRATKGKDKVHTITGPEGPQGE